MNKRQEQIVEIVERENTLSFSALKAYFPDISDITLRRDLAALHAEKRLVRLHGGVKSIQFRAGTDGEIAYRSTVHQDAKVAIARKAVSFLRPDTTVYIDSGSTCLELCLDVTHIHRLTVTLGGKAYKLTTFGHDAQYLLNAAIGIHGTGIGHGLHTNGIGATDGNTAHIDLNRCATRVVKKIHINLSYIHTEAP